MSAFQFAIAGQAKTTIETPVLIVGGGPTGLALAGDLGSRGVRCMLVDAAAGTTMDPRASALNARTMEFMRRWGIADAVAAAGLPQGTPRRTLYCTRLDGYRLAEIEHSAPSASRMSLSPQAARRLNQIRLDPILRDWASSFRDTRIEFRWRVESIDQRSECVLVDIVDLAARERRRIASQIVIDCSGADSRCRSRLGISTTASGEPEHFTTLHLRIPRLAERHAMERESAVELIDEAGVWRRLESLDGRDTYRLDIRSREPASSAAPRDTDAILTALAGGRLAHQLLTEETWIARTAIANRYGEGRILLAGDAAHVLHPESELGLDTGFGDAVDLAWKIEATLAGWASSSLLDSYEKERRPVAARNAAYAAKCLERARAIRSHPDIDLDTPAGRNARKQMTRELERGEHLNQVTDALALGYSYRNSPVICADFPPEPSAEHAAAYRPATSPGARAPHAPMPRGASTLDRYGKGFVLLRLGTRAPEPGPIDRAFAHRGVPLSFETIEDPAIAALHERRLVLVRPDGHVAWRGDALPADPLAVVDRVRGSA